MENDSLLPEIENLEESIDPDLLNRFPFAFLKKNCLLPVAGKDGEVILVTDPPLLLDIGEIQKMLKRDVRLARSSPEKILDCLERYYYHPSSSKKIIEDLQDQEIEQLPQDINGTAANLLDLANKAPVIRLVNQIIYRAVSMRASDIHLQTTETAFKVRYRVDGVLHDIFSLPNKYQAAIISRIKIISDLDIAEKRIPQDGRTSIRIDNRQIDIRISIIPTFFGESAVLRLLDKATFLYRMEELGLSGVSFSLFDRVIHYDHGIILLTGPTGSGKTTTLYSALSRINKPGINIMTLEDPVEYNLEGINQIQINPKVGLTFATGLRSILRHDPNIIMVGEIRDVETAEMAIQASLTGHLVFSTLHTNDAASAIARLLDMNVEPYLLASCLIGVMAQRLVGLNCPDCSVPVEIPAALLEEISLKGEALRDCSFREGRGCKKCFETGCYGRTGIFELLHVRDNISRLIMERASSSTIKKAALDNGMNTLRMDGAEKVRKGLTTVSEILRVTQEV